MPAVRRGSDARGHELSYSPSYLSSDSPPISALFLIYFDIKAGYTISWKRALTGIELEGIVEYKSLPSGLHTVKEDLIYFVHDQYAGVSAFVNAPDAESSRNARMIAVGVLIPLSYGRLGRSWKHAGALKAMGQELAKKPSETRILEEYWETHQASESGHTLHTGSSSESLPVLQQNHLGQQPGILNHGRTRSASDGTALLPPGHLLSSYHPARSLLSLLETFGPLIFPIYRAAILRKRILITCHAPVQQICEFVYDLSVISNIPLAVSSLLPESSPPQRIRPLFAIGVHDIPFLEDDLKASKVMSNNAAANDTDENYEGPDIRGCGWIACTTDGILAVKDNLYDILIALSPALPETDHHRVWPTIKASDGIDLKASQRDLRRYRMLTWGLSRLTQNVERSSAQRSNAQDTPSEHLGSGLVQDQSENDTDSIVEPPSWSALAYTGFMWWASAGERHIAMDDEFENDNSLLKGLDFEQQNPRLERPQALSEASPSAPSPEETAKHEIAIITYFHRLTTKIMTVLSDVIDAMDSDDDREDALLRDDNLQGEDGPIVFISSSDVAKMGLDAWSKTDQVFVEELVRMYFGRKAHVDGNTVDICGIKIC